MKNGLLDPQAQDLITRAQLRGARPIITLPPEEARKVYRESRLPTQPAPQLVDTCRDFFVPSVPQPVPVRAYRPLRSSATAALPTLVFFHGGGWVLGDRATHDVLCRDLCHLAGCAVFSVDYRLGPEHRFPAAFDDALAVTRWLAQHAQEFAIDVSRMAVGGDSAGGNLAAAVALGLRESADVKLVGQLLVYPVTDLRFQTESFKDFGAGYILSAADMLYFRDNYVSDVASCADWRASPLLADDHAGLPPALVVTAGFDPLRDEGRLYADKLSAAGNAVQYICFERQMHGFLGMGGIIAEANTAVRLCADWLKRYL